MRYISFIILILTLNAWGHPCEDAYLIQLKRVLPQEEALKRVLPAPDQPLILDIGGEGRVPGAIN